MIDLLNVRLGHACNSSSSHSMIFVDGEVPRDNYSEGQGFGWDYFTLSEPRSKRAYLAAQIFGAIRRAVGEQTAALIVDGLLEVQIPSGDNYFYGVDHQSAWGFPRDHKGEKYQPAELVSLHFVAELDAFMQREGVVVLGGNDNNGGHPFQGGESAAVPIENLSRFAVARKDGDIWVIYNQVTGTKIRFSFKDMGGELDYKPSTPELVDLKITDYCPFNCSYCYQGSTCQGEHADISTYSVACALAGMGVFEVAIGGGEPTFHPDFLKLLRTLREKDVVPNLTTRNVDFLFLPEAPTMLEQLGGIAFSINSADDITRIQDGLNAAGGTSRVSVQVVEGIVSDYKLAGIFRAAKEAGFSVTLLGFKETGRGKGFKKPHPSNRSWIDVAAEASGKNRLPRLSVDTVIAARDEELIQAEDIPRWLYHTEEGRYSMYWDLTTSKIGPSSFCPEAEMVSLGEEERNWQIEIGAAFAGWPQ